MEMHTLDEIGGVNIYPATEEHEHLLAFDHTRLSAVNVCPQWGVLRYVHHKTFHNSGRAMPLEAGKAAHEVYAAARLWQIGRMQGHRKIMDRAGVRVFKGDRYENMLSGIDNREDERNQMLNFCLGALYTSGFYDDPMDKRRTMSNIEEACIAYLDRLPHAKHPVWIEDESDENTRVGIELPINVVMDFGELKYRLIGRCDGLHWHDDKLYVHENKTASRLGEAWALSFDLSHQVTGYCVGLSTMLGLPIHNAAVHGMSIPLPRNYDFGGLVTENVRRPNYLISSWCEWFLHTAQIVEQYKNDPLNVPKYTHSCNRYFRACQFIPFCAVEPEERAEIYKEMVTQEWNPLDDSSGD